MDKKDLSEFKAEPEDNEVSEEQEQCQDYPKKVSICGKVSDCYFVKTGGGWIND